VSRAYYGAFHVARSFLSELGFEPIGNANVHAFIQRYLSGPSHPDSYIAATELAYLHSARNRADCDLDDSNVGTRAYAMVSVERAHRVVAALGAGRQDDVRAAIRAAIAAYEQRVRPR